ncbi:HD domain-containing response regulator [Rhodoferax aquaticus]|uniref:GAF domain-containing protein n=1 Tax=Rhodoferax aquaticus TaxID=2527691 RepID=A0A515EKM8_9BURK|nr:HD domain-containing phosphohydrolase [Rhodoferax aquaticus]QDL53222.1 GAF domain-containing protein [Rhodoferax aquaticus]
MPALDASAIPADLLSCHVVVLGTEAAGLDAALTLLAQLGHTRITAHTSATEVITIATESAVHACVLVATDAAAVRLIDQLRNSRSTALLPILAWVPESAQALGAEALIAGANDCVRTPPHPTELAIRLRKLLLAQGSHQRHTREQLALEAQVQARTARLDMLIENGILMAQTRERHQLMRHTLFEGRKLLHCDAGSMYLATEQDSLRFAMRTRDDTLPAIEIPLHDRSTGAPNIHYVSTWCALHKQSVRIDDVYRETRFDLQGTRRFDESSGYRTVSMLTVPMAPRGGEVLGVLQFINCLDPVTGEVVPFPEDCVSLVEALAAQAAVALDNLALIDERKAFMESLIHTIATAIDAKSPYTGRHSARVPELALMLARAAHATQQGPLAPFSFATEDEWHEFRVGAWLHDCGKITTPEYVIDKATKLETIYNRIHEVRMRFEVLLRDAQMEALQAQLNGDDAAACARKLEQTKWQLAEDFAFIARCNLGEEDMAPDHMERVRRMGQVTWQRNFDDCVGLAHEELQRRSAQGLRPLPATESLLADMPWHLIARGHADVPPEHFGFRVDIPQWLANQGEVYNLCLRRGTLTPEDRYKINEHMIHGIMMLERMPFPKSLQRVPEYAGTHHESLNGTGYPRRLQAQDLSVPARIMMIADVFEALTAIDRPYKTPKKFSEAIAILHSLKLNGHIDADLFDLFLTSGVHLEYAKQYLAPEQIDAVDIRNYLS